MGLLYVSGSMASEAFFHSQGLYLGVPFNPLEIIWITKLRKGLSSCNTAWPQWDLSVRSPLKETGQMDLGYLHCSAPGPQTKGLLQNVFAQMSQLVNLILTYWMIIMLVGLQINSGCWAIPSKGDSDFLSLCSS